MSDRKIYTDSKPGCCTSELCSEYLVLVFPQNANLTVSKIRDPVSTSRLTSSKTFNFQLLRFDWPVRQIKIKNIFMNLAGVQKNESFHIQLWLLHHLVIPDWYSVHLQTINILLIQQSRGLHPTTLRLNH